MRACMRCAVTTATATQKYISISLTEGWVFERLMIFCSCARLLKKLRRCCSQWMRITRTMWLAGRSISFGVLIFVPLHCCALSKLRPAAKTEALKMKEMPSSFASLSYSSHRAVCSGGSNGIWSIFSVLGRVSAMRMRRSCFVFRAACDTQ